MQVIGDIVRLNAKRYPDKNALIMDDKHLTHGQLNQQVNQLAHGLLSVGVRPGDRVAILAYNAIREMSLFILSTTLSLKFCFSGLILFPLLKMPRPNLFRLSIWRPFPERSWIQVLV